MGKSRTTSRPVWCRMVGLSAVLGMGGCSLVFSGGDYQGGVMDAGARDSSAPDSGVDSGGDSGARSRVVVIAKNERAVWNLETGVLKHDESSGQTVAFEVKSQDAGAPRLVIFSLDSFTMEKGSKLTFELGEENRAIALDVTGAVVIEGELNVSAQGDTGGPGGASSDRDGEPSDAWPLNGQPGRYDDDGLGALPAVLAFSGGGGGSNGAAGGAGGAADAHATQTGYDVAIPGGAAGQLAADVSDWSTSLFGGGAGGPTVCVGVWDVRGGGGGGAIRVTSGSSIVVGESAAIIASGAGGRSRDEAESLHRCQRGAAAGGGGAGAGGTVVLDAPDVVVRGGIFANGGGGSGGDALLAGPGPGQDGKSSTTTAAGSLGYMSNDGKYVAGDGGKGGVGAHPAGYVGANASATSTDGLLVYPTASGGGGGGGVGRIVLRTNDGATPSGGKFSPEPVTETRDP